VEYNDIYIRGAEAAIVDGNHGPTFTV